MKGHSMPKKGARHLTLEQRCHISVCLQSGMSQEQISDMVGVDQSTVSRELRRNKVNDSYDFKQADEKAQQRRIIASSVPRKMNKELWFSIVKKITEEQWSPEQISGRFKKEGISISNECIRQYILKDKKKNGLLSKFLRRGGKKYNKRANKNAGRGLIPNRVGIEKRPEIVNKKERVGDFEIDTIIGKSHQGAILSIVDRKTKLTKLKLLPNKKSDNTAQALIESLNPIKDHVHTITSDNGKEFAGHELVSSQLKAQFFFAQPYHSWERGLNENTNGLVREYFPKDCNFNNITEEEVRYVENRLNSRPRKTLNFDTPYEVFQQLTGINAVPLFDAAPNAF